MGFRAANASLSRSESQPRGFRVLDKDLTEPARRSKLEGTHLPFPAFFAGRASKSSFRLRMRLLSIVAVRAAAAVLLALLPIVANSADRDLSFNRDIRPILSDKCFACHGFDAKKREAELRLDTADGATAVHDGVRAIVPGDLTKSALWQRINSTDQDE